MTSVTYNGISINNVETKSFGQEVKYDDSGTDKVRGEYRIRVAGSVHADSLASHGSFVDGGLLANPVAMMAELNRRLTEARKDFVFTVGSEVLIQATASGASAFRDVNNGPKPRNVLITQVGGRSIFRVEFEIEISLIGCAFSLGSAGSFVLNNKWSVEEVMDSEFFITRTLEGTLRVATIEATPHAYRYLCLPPLQDGFQRQSQRFVDTPDGLTLRYQIVDRQRNAAPPAPANYWSGEHSESTVHVGTTGVSQFRLELGGPPGVSKLEMIVQAVRIAELRTGVDLPTYSSQGTGKFRAWIENFTIRDRFDANRIEVSATVRHTMANEDTRYFNARVSRMGTIELEGYDPDKWLTPLPYSDTSPSWAFSKFLQDPCNHSAPRVPGALPITPFGELPADHEKVDTFIFEGQDPTSNEDDNGGVSDEQRDGDHPYTFYDIETRYETRDHVAQLPIARWNASPSSAATSVLIPLHRPLCKKHVFVHAERVGAWPQMPNPVESLRDVNGINMRRDRFTPIDKRPQLMPDGKTRKFMIQAEYVYLMERPPSATEKFEAGADIREEGSPTDNLITGSDVFTDQEIL